VEKIRQGIAGLSLVPSNMSPRIWTNIKTNRLQEVRSNFIFSDFNLAHQSRNSPHWRSLAGPSPQPYPTGYSPPLLQSAYHFAYPSGFHFRCEAHQLWSSTTERWGEGFGEGELCVVAQNSHLRSILGVMRSGLE